MMEKRSRRTPPSVKLVIISIVILAVLILLFVGMSIDADEYQMLKEQPKMDPYIELTALEGEQYLVGDLVVQWLNGVESGQDFYNEFSSIGKVYTAKPVTIRYTIYDIPYHVSVVRQEVELSNEESMEYARCYDLSGEKRSITFENLYTGYTYYYRITAYLSDGSEISANAQFETAETPRIISTEGVWNMRDIGGAQTLDGKRLKQGMVYRGVELDGAVYYRYCITKAGAKILTDEFGIRTEFDLRGEKENMRDMLGANVKHNVYPAIYAYCESLIPYSLENYGQLFSDLANEENYPAYIHCSYGKDRTGTVVFLLQLLLGVSEEDAYKEWELSVLSDGVLAYELMDDYIDALYELEGDTLQEKVENHILSCGVTKEEIERIREILIEDYVSDNTDVIS